MRLKTLLLVLLSFMTVPSHRGTQEGSSSIPITALLSTHGYQYLKSLFHGDRFSGTCIHIFQACEAIVYDLLEARGLQIHPELALHDNRVKLLQHVIHGDCYRDPEDDAHRPMISLPYACCLAVKNHDSSQDIQRS